MGLVDLVGPTPDLDDSELRSYRLSGLSSLSRHLEGLPDRPSYSETETRRRASGRRPSWWRRRWGLRGGREDGGLSLVYAPTSFSPLRRATCAPVLTN